MAKVRASWVNTIDLMKMSIDAASCSMVESCCIIMPKSVQHQMNSWFILITSWYRVVITHCFRIGWFWKNPNKRFERQGEIRKSSNNIMAMIQGISGYLASSLKDSIFISAMVVSLLSSFCCKIYGSLAFYSSSLLFGTILRSFRWMNYSNIKTYINLNSISYVICLSSFETTF